MVLLLQAANITYAHGGNELFRNLQFSIQTGDRIALVGENGTGKSTLFRLLTRELYPQEGAVTHANGITIGFLRQESDLPAHKTVREVLSAAIGDADALEFELLEIEERFSEPLSDEEMSALLDRQAHLLDRLDSAAATDVTEQLQDVLGELRIPDHRWDQPIGTLSGGERKLIDVAQFLLEQPDVLLLDEPDNHFDTETRSWLEHWLTTRFTGALCMISHDRYMIDRVATTIVELEDGKVRSYPGNYSAFQQQKRARIERELELRELAEREYLKMKVSSEELTQWARQNPKFASRAEQARKRLVEERARLDAQPWPKLQRNTATIQFDAERGSTNVVTGSNVSIRFGDRVVLRPFDVLVRHGERVGIIGPNGAGKTSLMKCLTGDLAPTSGSIGIGASIVMAWYDQLHGTLHPNAQPIELVRKAKALNEQQALSALVAMGFDRIDAMNPVKNLSGGEQARLQIALMMLSGANLLVLDEPTNNLDLASVEQLEDALLEYDGTIISISHDRYFMDRVCTRILAIEDGVVRDYPGGYTYAIANPEKGTPLTLGLRHPAAVDDSPKKKRR
ncbi:MAG: ATP-binding cassette domain-containing protein [Thermomicrobiales bacterium]|nr:ATP-binding cassette domain-containing protein [Thermomicrobiales bacterium]